MEGEAIYRIDGEERRMGPGDKAVVPKGVKHAFRNAGQGVAYLRFESEPPMELQDSVEVAVAMTHAERLSARGMPRDPRALVSAAGYAELVAAALDQVGGAPADDAHVAVRGDGGQVAGAEPAVVAERLARRVGTIQVAEEEVRAAQLDPADRLVVARLDRPAVVVHQAQ